jgi:hypothetical protein
MTESLQSASRRRLLEQTAADTGEAWAHRSLLGLRAEGRAVVGGWPGTLTEARAWVSAALVREGARATMAELDAAARSTYACARVAWLACASREEDEPFLASPQAGPLVVASPQARPLVPSPQAGSLVLASRGPLAGVVVTTAVAVLPLLEAGTNPSVNKRQKERQRQEHQREKAEKRKQRRDEKPARPAGAGGEDPDIAGIVPGPQPVQEV